MKCLSVQQPWAELIVNGPKDVENRGWRTPYRGPLLIHAGKKFDADGYRWLEAEGLITLSEAEAKSLPRGALVGRVVLDDCTEEVPKSGIEWRDPDTDIGWRDPDQAGWYLENRVAFAKPIPYRGQRGLFEVPDDVLDLTPQPEKETPTMPDHENTVTLSVHAVDDGAAVATLETALQAICDDVLARPKVQKPRLVALQIKLTPETVEGSDTPSIEGAAVATLETALQAVCVAWSVAQKVPPVTGPTRQAFVAGGKVKLELDPDNPYQMLLELDEPEADADEAA